MPGKRPICRLILAFFAILAVMGAVPGGAAPGMRVKLRLKNGAVFFGRIARIDDRMISLEPLTAEGKPVGLLGIEMTDVHSIERLSGKSLESLLAEVQPRKSAKETPPKVEAKEPEKVEKGPRRLTPEERVLLRLVDEFPPEQGWGEKRIKEIDRRWVMMDLRPTDREKRFKKLFPQWRRAVALKKKLESEKAAEQKAAESRREKLENLLEEFPPDQGWSEKRYNELYEKLSKAMSDFSSDEIRFMEIYEQLKRGRALGKGKLGALPEALSPEERALVKLVAEWPLDEGWTQARYDELREARRKAESILTESEKRFLEVFPNWRKAVESPEEKGVSKARGE